jgi:hypothetical protein
LGEAGEGDHEAVGLDLDGEETAGEGVSVVAGLLEGSEEADDGLGVGGVFIVEFMGEGGGEHAGGGELLAEVVVEFHAEVEAFIFDEARDFGFEAAVGVHLGLEVGIGAGELSGAMGDTGFELGVGLTEFELRLAEGFLHAFARGDIFGGDDGAADGVVEIEEGDGIFDEKDTAAVGEDEFDFDAEDGLAGGGGDMGGHLFGGEFDAVAEHLVGDHFFILGRGEGDVGVAWDVEEAVGGDVAGDVAALGVVGEPDGDGGGIEKGLKFSGALAFGVLTFTEGFLGVLTIGDFALEVGVELFELAAGFDGVFHEVEGGAVGIAEFDVGGMLLGFLAFHAERFGGIFDAMDDAGDGAIGMEEGEVGDIPVAFFMVPFVAVGAADVKPADAEAIVGAGIKDAQEGGAGDIGEGVGGVVGMAGVDIEEGTAEGLAAVEASIAEEGIGDGEDGEARRVGRQDEETSGQGVEDPREIHLQFSVVTHGTSSGAIV